MLNEGKRNKNSIRGSLIRWSYEVGIPEYSTTLSLNYNVHHPFCSFKSLLFKQSASKAPHMFIWKDLIVEFWALGKGIRKRGGNFSMRYICSYSWKFIFYICSKYVKRCFADFTLLLEYQISSRYIGAKKKKIFREKDIHKSTIRILINTIKQQQIHHKFAKVENKLF